MKNRFKAEKYIDSANKVFIQVSPTLILYKLFNFMDSDPESFTVKPVEFDIPLCTIYYLECLTVKSAYLIEISAFHLAFHPYYIRIRRYENLNKTSFKNCKFAWQDDFLNVIYSVEGATIISPNDLKWIIKPNMVRKTDRKNDES